MPVWSPYAPFVPSIALDSFILCMCHGQRNGSHAATIIDRPSHVCWMGQSHHFLANSMVVFLFHGVSEAYGMLGISMDSIRSGPCNRPWSNGTGLPFLRCLFSCTPSSTIELSMDASLCSPILHFKHRNTHFSWCVHPCIGYASLVLPGHVTFSPFLPPNSIF